MNVDLKMGGQKVMALWTMGQPTIFFVIWEAAKLSLKLKKDDSKLKVVNNKA